MQFDLLLYGSIDICVSSIYMYVIRFIFVQFDLYERVLKILSVTERHRPVVQTNGVETGMHCQASQSCLDFPGNAIT